MTFHKNVQMTSHTVVPEIGSFGNVAAVFSKRRYVCFDRISNCLDQQMSKSANVLPESANGRGG